MLIDLNFVLIIIISLFATNNGSLLDSIRKAINPLKSSESCSVYTNIPLVDPIKASIRTLAEDLSACRYSSSDLVRWYLKRINDVNEQGSHPLHAVIETNPDALNIANKLDEERQINSTRSLLHGIPILIKDSIATNDKMETTAGSLALVGSRVPRDAFIVQKLREAGAIILGKASLTEWGNVRSENSTRDGWSARGGTSSSAYVADADPGGSSSGSAIATSAGLCAAAIGTETFGSIIVPSGRAAIVGLKTTVGLTSRSGAIPISHDHDTIGPMGKTVEDVALLLEVIQGVDSRDNATQQSGIIRHTNYTQFLLGVEGLRHLRLGVVRQGINISEEKKEQVHKAIEIMRFHGVDIIDPVNLTNLANVNITTGLLPLCSYNFRHDIAKYLSELKNTTMKTLKDLIEFNKAHVDQEFHPKYFPDQNLFISSENQTNFTAHDYEILFNKTRQMNGRDGIDATLKEYKLDALIIPDSEHDTILMAAYAGYPLIVVPLGFNQSNNAPYGLMFAASAWSEPMLIRIAHGFEQAFPIRNTVRPKYAENNGFLLELLFKIIELLKKLHIM